MRDLAGRMVPVSESRTHQVDRYGLPEILTNGDLQKSGQLYPAGSRFLKKLTIDTHVCALFRDSIASYVPVRSQSLVSCANQSVR